MDVGVGVAGIRPRSLPVMLHVPPGAAVLAGPVAERQDATLLVDPRRVLLGEARVRADEHVVRHPVRAARGAGAARLVVRLWRLIAEEHDHGANVGRGPTGRRPPPTLPSR